MPAFQPSQRRLLAAQEWARSRHGELDAKNGAAIQAATDRFAASRDADVVVARCEAHTTTIAFHALSRLLRAMFKVEGLGDAEAHTHTAAQFQGLLPPRAADAQILFEVMGIADTNAPQLQVSVDGRRRRLVEVMAQAAQARPTRTVFVLEDAHWIDAPSDDVIADFAATLNATSMFITTYRPEFHGALHHNSGQTITLRPLTDSMAVRLVDHLLGEDPSLSGLAERIAVAAVGNPFFVEEIVRDLAGRGLLSGSRGGYRLLGDVDEIAVPATVQAVLAARIDRLHPEAKSILNAAAVIGTHFDADTLQALLPEVESTLLAELVSAELIDQTEFVPLQRYCFHHPLVRTVAYESQLSTDACPGTPQTGGRDRGARPQCRRECGADRHTSRGGRRTWGGLPLAYARGGMASASRSSRRTRTMGERTLHRRPTTR